MPSNKELADAAVEALEIEHDVREIPDAVYTALDALRQMPDVAQRLLALKDGRACLKWFTPSGEPYVLVIDPQKGHAYVAIHATEDQPPTDNSNLVWKA